MTGRSARPVVVVAIAILAIALATPAPAQEPPPSTTTTPSPPTTRRPPRPPAPSTTAPPETVPEAVPRLQEQGQIAVRLRLTTVAGLRAQVTDEETLAADERTQIVAQLDAAEAGLLGLAESIEASVGRDAIEPLLAAIVEAHRVFAVLHPKVHLLLAGSLAAAAAADLVALADRIDGLAGRAADDVDPLTERIRVGAFSAASAAGQVLDLVRDLDAGDYPNSTETVGQALVILGAGRSSLADAQAASILAAALLPG